MPALRSAPLIPGVLDSQYARRAIWLGAFRVLVATFPLVATARGAASTAEAPPAATAFRQDIVPILENYCYDCHGDGSAKGKVAFDELTDAELTTRTDLWFAALKNVRANIMPPADKPQPTAEEIKQIASWIKYRAFGIDPHSPDPGRVTLRRLNRIEYGRTIHTLLGADFPSEAEFPPDDTGHGFDNIGDVLSLSPMLLEKYLQAAEIIVDGIVPQSSRITPLITATGRDFRDYEDPTDHQKFGPDGSPVSHSAYGNPLSYAETTTVQHVFKVSQDSTYHLALNLELRGPFNFNAARCRLTIKIDGVSCYDEELGSHDTKPVHLGYDQTWSAGSHEVSFSVAPLPPAAAIVDPLGPGFEDKQKPEVRIVSVQVQGPFDEASRVTPDNYRKFFPRGEPSPVAAERERYAREIIGTFASRAFRRPIDEGLLTRLTQLARNVDTSPGGTFEQGISRAMMAILASPRFLFRIEQPDTQDSKEHFPRVDQYSLASRLSYFLWSTMPDETLLNLAERGELRNNLRPQVERMLKDPQSTAFVHNFTGQWLQARDVEVVPINARVVLGLPPPRRGGPKADFDGDTRRAMRHETEMVFEHIMSEDRSVLELVESNYTYLNEKLAKVYGLPGVSGNAMRLVTLPENSPRGGVLTQGTVLTVTSNPTRTSPVKRGQFILENILGTPTPPPPPNIPALEEAKNAFGGREPTLREMLAVHREDSLCRSCHARMDPLGLAFENFNALGNWRTQEAGQAIDATGKLITGESFADVRELKRLIANERRTDYFRCLTEKLLTYALGRGLEYYDVETVDQIVADLERDGGRFSTLLLGVIESAPFQKQRLINSASVTAQAAPPASGSPLTSAIP